MMTSRLDRGCNTRILDLAGKRYIHNDLGPRVSGPDFDATGDYSKDFPVHETSRTEGSTTSIEERLTSCPSAYEQRTPASPSECGTQEGLSTDSYADPTDQRITELDQLGGSLGGNTSVGARRRHPLLSPYSNASDSDAYSIVDSTSDSSLGLCDRPHIRPSQRPGEDTPKPPKGVCPSFWTTGKAECSRKTVRQRNNCKNIGCYVTNPSISRGGSRSGVQPTTSRGSRLMGTPPTTRRRAGVGADGAPPRNLPEYTGIDSDHQPNQRTGRDFADAESPPMVQTGMQGTSVRELRNAYEANAHARVSSKTAQSTTELRTQLAVQECMHQTLTLEAKCRASLATRESQAIVILSGIEQRHDALVLLEDSLDLARTRFASLWAASESDSASYTASQTYELDKFRTRMTEEVANVEAEVAARGEVLRRFIAEAAAKATLEQHEFRDAVSRACTAAEARYRADLLRERQAHERARDAMATNVD